MNADLPPPAIIKPADSLQNAETDGLILRLGAESFQIREEAQQRLVELLKRDMLAEKVPVSEIKSILRQMAEYEKSHPEFQRLLPFPKP